MTEEQRQFLESRIQAGDRLQTTDLLRDGFRLYRLYPWGFLALALLPSLMSSALSVLPNSLPWTLLLSALVLSPLFTIGFYIGGQRLLEEGRLVFTDFFDYRGRVVPLLIHQALYVLVLAVSLIPTWLVLNRIGYFEWYGVAMENPMDPPPPPELASFDSTMLLANFIPFTYLGVSFLLTYPLLFFFQTTPWGALEYSRRLVGRNWFTFFSLVLFFLSVALLGSMLLGVLMAQGGILAFIASLALFVLLPWFHLSLFAGFTRAMNPAAPEE